MTDTQAPGSEEYGVLAAQIADCAAFLDSLKDKYGAAKSFTEIALRASDAIETLSRPRPRPQPPTGGEVMGCEWRDQIITGTLEAFAARMKHVLDNKGSMIGLTDAQSEKLVHTLTGDVEWLMRAAHFFADEPIPAQGATCKPDLQVQTPPAHGEGELRVCVIEECAKICDEHGFKGTDEAITADYIAKKIRALSHAQAGDHAPARAGVDEAARRVAMIRAARCRKPTPNRPITEAEIAHRDTAELREEIEAVLASTPPQDGNARLVSENLAAMLRRMTWQVRKETGDTSMKVLAGKASELLARYGLQGTPLRSGSAE